MSQDELEAKVVKLSNDIVGLCDLLVKVCDVLEQNYRTVQALHTRLIAVESKQESDPTQATTFRSYC